MSRERFAIRAGWFQLGVDLLVLALAIPVIGWTAALLSVAGALALNIILGINQSPVSNIEEFRKLIDAAGSNVALLVKRMDNTLYVPLRLGN